MLKNYFISFKFFRFVQSGLYLDFFIKKIVEVFIKNFFVFSSLFFGEKFLIEYITKKTIDSVIFNSQKFDFFFELLYSKFFISLVFFIFFFWSLFIFFVF